MRAIVFFLSLFFLLSGNAAFANVKAKDTHLTYSNITRNHQSTFSNKIQDTNLIEDSDIDLEEEFANADQVKSISSDKLFIDKNHFLNTFYAVNSMLIVAKQSNSNFKIFSPFRGNFTPIYITQRVLRL